MARLFDDAQSEYLKIESPVVVAYPFAMACKFRCNEDTIFNSLMWVGDKDVEDYFSSLQARGDSGAGNRVRSVSQKYGAASAWFAETTSDFTKDVWGHAAGIYLNVSERHAYFDGGNKGSNTGTVGAMANHDRTTIGVRGSSTLLGYMSGDIAEAAIWDLSDWGENDAERETAFEAVIVALAANESPANYPLGLVAYWPERDDDLDDAGSFNLTPINTPSWSTHPSVIYHLAGNIATQSALTAYISATEKLAGSVGVTSSLTALLNEIAELTGLVEAQSALTGAIDKVSIYNLAGLISVQSALTGNINEIAKLVGSLGGQSALIGNIYKVSVYNLAGLIAGQSSASGNINTIEKLSGLVAVQSALTGKLRDLSSLSGTIDATTTTTGLLNAVEKLSGDIAAQSSLTGNIQFCYGSIPPAMHANLIDPYSGGAWLWLVEVRIPGYSLIRLARNTEDIIYGGITYLADNFTIGLDPLTGEGSVPRTLLRVAQDANYTLEDILNATKGGYGGRITIIRTHEDFLTIPIVELEDTVDILTSESDTEHIIIPCGIPNPLIRKIPLWRGSSKICSWASPGLFKGVDCQYAGGDGTCTGKYEDCYAKGNAVHWGGELGLDPTVTKV